MLLHSMCTGSLNFNKVLMAKYKVIFLHFIMSSIFVQYMCLFLNSSVSYSKLQCPNGTIGVFEDTCTFSCNAGYELQGSNNGTCLAISEQSWSWSELQLQL